MLRAFVDEKTLEKTRAGYYPCGYLYYHFGPSINPNMLSLSNAFLKDKKFFELTDSPQKCDIIVMPHNYFKLRRLGENEIINRYLELAQKYDKFVLINAKGDQDENLSIPNSIIIRYSQYRYKLQPNEIIVPPPVYDLGKIYGIRYRSKANRPTVGFAGLATYRSQKAFVNDIKRSLLCDIKHIFDGYSKVRKSSIWYRRRAIEAVKANTNITANVIIRSFWAGGRANIKGRDPDVLKKEYVKNMMESDFVLCPKGAGNFSLRFYETLSMGRIPVVIDTEMPLPLDDRINYSEFCLVVHYRDANKLGHIIERFYQDLSNDDFLEMQHRAREIFERYLVIDRFYELLFNAIIPERMRLLHSPQVMQGS